jgi:hypothetical protein
MKNIYRLFFALWYLLGWVVHVYLGLWSPDIYKVFSTTAIFAPFQWFWLNVLIPNITIFALLLAIIEIVIGSLLINKGIWVKLGVALSMTFNLFLVCLGLSWLADTAELDLVINRLPNLVFAAAQIPLLWIRFDQTIPEIIRGKFRPSRKK